MARLRFVRQSFQRPRAPLRPLTVEIGDVLLRLQEARYPLVLRAMLPSNERCSLDAARITYLGGVRITLKQKRLWPGTRRASDNR